MSFFCNKTFECCKDLHDNEERFGGFYTSSIDSSGKVSHCPFKFGDGSCKALDPTSVSLRLWWLLYDARAKIVTLNDKIEETLKTVRELPDYDPM